MSMHRFLLESLVILALVTGFHRSKVNGSTSHVCSANYYVTSYYSRMNSGWGYRTYYTSCGFLWLNRCSRYTRIRRYYYVLKTHTTTDTRYYCCSGWRSARGHYCSIPICRYGCVHGKCTAPNKCTCNSGWTGNRCNIDVNECLSSIDGCQHQCINTIGSFICGCYRGYYKPKSYTKTCRDINECTKHSSCTCASRVDADVCRATCINSPGSYRCSCSNGFKLMASRNICQDVDECSGQPNRCGKTQHCINTLGSYNCFCRHGYKRKQNRSVCADINECKTNNGECEHICINIPGSRRCMCRRGYRLDSNDRSCTDINECRGSAHRCQYACRNTKGSFTCYCSPGYELNPDKRTCSDVNECRRYKGRYVPLSTCQQVCTNTDGSYTCGCRRGFNIQQDGRSCKDIDECKTRAHLCGQICINTIGSYFCSCKAGYELKSDGKSCKTLTCQIIKKPLYAALNCSGTATGDVCSVSCSHGYNREGPSKVTCLSNQIWSVPQPTCRPKMCSILSPRPNAIVSLPCYRHFRSTCDMRCKSGYYSSGRGKTTCDLTADQQNVVWKSDLKCFQVKNCKPNPCRHGGTCISLSPKDFQCDCSKSGHEGRLCERGVIDIPLFPKLKANISSPYLSLRAKPSKEIQVSIQSDDVVANPNVFIMTKSSRNKYFALRAQRPGFKVISYYISQGDNEDYFKKPEDSILFVAPERSKTPSIFAENIAILEDELPKGCYMTALNNLKCSVQLSSTLPWNQFTNQQLSSQGIVHLTTKDGKSIPLSLIGYDIPCSSNNILNKIRYFHQLSNNAKLYISAANTCKKSTIGIHGITELIENDVFATTFFKTFSKLAPSWMTISSKEEISVFDIKNIYTLISSKSNACSLFFNSSSVVAYEPNIGPILTLDEDITLPDERGFCYAIDVCTSDVGLTLPSESTKAIKSSVLFQDMRNAGWDIDLTGIMFPGNGKGTVSIGQSLWNGRQLENLESQEYEVVLKGRMKMKLGNKGNTKTSLAYEGDMFLDTENLEESFHYGFERKIAIVLKGKAAMNLTTSFFGKQVMINLPKQEVVGKSAMGGANKPRDSIYDQGWFIVWKSASNLLQGTPFDHTVHPKRNHPVFVALEHQIRGGRQREIANIKEYNLVITLMRLLIPHMKSLLKNPKLLLLLKTETIEKWTAEIDNTKFLLRGIRSAMRSDLSRSSSLNKFSVLITKLRNQIRSIKLIFQVIGSEVIRSFGNMPLIVNQAKSLKNDIPKIPSVRWKRSAIIEVFRKFKLLFEGKICSKKTCFDDIKIILESAPPKNINAAHHQDQNHNLSFAVQGKWTKPLTLGSVASLKKNDHVLLEIYNRTKSSRLSFNPTIHVLGIRKVVTAVVENDVLSFQTSGLIFRKYQALIKVSAQTEHQDWSLIQYHLQGRIDLNSSLAKIFQKKINTHVRDIAEKAILRVRNAESEAKEISEKLRSSTKSLRQKSRTYEDLQQKKGAQLSMLNKYKTKYELFKNQAYEGVHEDDEEPKRYSYPLSLTECEKICSRMRVCSYEKKKRVITYDVPNCFAKEKTIEKEKVVQQSANTFYVKKTFVSQYTGTCGTGGFWRTLAQLFTGCSRSYAMLRGQDEKVPYTKVWLARVKEKINVKVFDCSNSPVSEMKFIDGHEFSCEKTMCINVMNSTCVKNNMEASEMYNITNSDESLSDYKKLKAKQFENLTHIASLLDIAAINLEETKAELENARKELSVNRAQMAQLENAKNELELAVSKIKSIPDVKLGLRWSRIVKKHRDKNIVNVTDLTFDMPIADQTNLKKQMPMTIAVLPVEGLKKKYISVLFDFEKEDISIQRVIKQVTRDLLEKKRDAARKKRSIPDNVLNKFVTTVGNQASKLKEWNNHRHCLKARKGKLFYTDVVNSLDQLIHVRKEVEQSNKDNVIKLVSLYKTFEKITNEEAKGAEHGNSKNVLKSYLHYFTLLINKKENFTKSWEDALVIWKTMLEGITKERSFSECAGFRDCLVSIAEDLSDLYLYERDFFRANEIRENITYVKDSIVDLISKDFTLKDFKTRVLDLKSHLYHTEDTDVLCGRKPAISFVSGGPESVVENETLTLFCNATSDTKVTYHWIHNNESVIQTANGLLIIRKVNKSHAGSYKCKVINRKGFAISNVTVISVKSKPKITEHPNDTKVYAKDGKGLYLVCNATGDPEPDIEWFFISQYPNSSEVRLYNHDNGTFLYYEKPIANYSGYYYCIARNIYGRAKSKRARVWVLDVSPGQPRIEVKLNITKACNKNNSSLNCSKYRRENSRDPYALDYIHQELAALLNCSLSQIENISYISDTNGNSRSIVHFLYIGRNPIIENFVDRIDFIEPVFEMVLDSFARKRKQLVEEVQYLYQTMKNKTVSYREETVDPESLLVRGAPPGCPTGKEPHSNGFLCVNCPPGSYRNPDGWCMPCPLQTYQYEQGQTECIPCEDGLQTKTLGTISPQECFKIRYAPPRSLEVTALGSSKLHIRWLKPNLASEFVRSYIIKYSRPGYENETANVSTSKMKWTLTGLKPFTLYHISVYAVYSDATKMTKFKAITGEEVPDAAPVLTECIPLSHESARITWSPIPKNKRNGIIRGYNIYFKAGVGGKWQKWQEHIIRSGILTSYDITGLKSSTWYCFKMSAFTSKGQYQYWRESECWVIKTPYIQGSKE